MAANRIPSLSALRAFEAAARYQSAKRAAEELSVTPTAISHQIRLLEDELGLALFVRKPRQLILTTQGKELQSVLSDSFDSIAAVVQRLKTKPERQAITLSTTPAIAVRWLLPWISRLRESHPKLDLRIHATHEVVELDGVTADLAIRYGKGDWPGLVAEKLFDNRFIPACSPKLHIRKPKDLCRYPLIHFEPNNAKSVPVDWEIWQHFAKVPGLDISAGPIFSDETHAVSATLNGEGVALMSKALIMDELENGRLVQPFGPELKAEPFHLVYPERRRKDPAIMSVRDWIMGLS
ncbi:LysR family transcriptional regulator [Hahella sp. CCB-MM4]|uniref:LysR substrate-binding domain-containing protein n=1 Tax=Hahella sp. (strain CCB-MM4) TaxID=1926491 RepID=UPI000B9B9784|nr:LysR substrate-binding domain-containing protein [Hahella sp. CCB-MM4]OZG74801.1 LysR family transcriptional regulator [Hahella sp. CCB-MM4]